MRLGLRQDVVVKGDGGPRDPQRLGVDRVRWHCGPVNDDRVAGPTLKWWVTLLCDYSGVEDPTRETREMFDTSKVVRLVEGLASSRTIVTTKCAVEAFSVTHRPNLVSHLDPFFVSSLKVVS